MNIYTKFFFNFHNSCFFAILTNFTTVYRYKHIFNFNISTIKKYRHCFSYSCSCCNNIFNYYNSITVNRFITYKASTFAMVFNFFSIKEICFINIIFCCKCSCCCCCKRNTFISRTKHCIKFITASFFYKFSIKFCKCSNLFTCFIITCIYKVWCKTSAFCFKLTKTKNISTHHKFNKFFFLCC